MIQAVIFDFNGVILDDEHLHFAMFQEILAQEGVHITEKDYHDTYLGLDDRGCFETALSNFGQSADAHEGWRFNRGHNGSLHHARQQPGK